jgi:hypothetical protein
VYRHQGKDYDAQEHTIATFSWLQGNHFPGYALLTLYPSAVITPNTSNHPTFQIEKCGLPPQIRIYMWYIVLLIITILGSSVLTFFKELDFVKDGAYIPLYDIPRRRSGIFSSSDEYRGRHRDKSYRLVEKTCLHFAKTVAFTLAFYIIVLLII